MSKACSNNGKKGMYAGYWSEGQKERDHYDGKDVRGWIIPLATFETKIKLMACFP
jgi:hypothetical protein